MIGFFIGVVCLVGLGFVLTSHRRRGYAHGGWHHGHVHYGRGWGFGPRALLRRLFSDLDTTPGQEKAIVSAFSDLRAEVETFRGVPRKTREAIAKAMASNDFDAAAVEREFQEHDAALATIRARAMQTLRTVHDSLDERQRTRLARIVERGGVRGACGFAEGC